MSVQSVFSYRIDGQIPGEFGANIESASHSDTLINLAIAESGINASTLVVLNDYITEMRSVNA